jgi:LmbE family N-acetylglucosaminyl deacetylase
MRVLAVGAHPDDLEILCGGTLARFAAEGHEVTMCHASTGNRGSFVHTSEELIEIRKAEASKAAGLVGARHRTLGLSDGDVLSSDQSQRREVIDLVREVRPDVIITHYPSDYMSDHNEISKLVFDASFHATLPLYKTDKPAHNVVAPIFYMDTVMGVGFQPAEYVDVTSVIETKIAMLECHQSQLTWLREHDDVNIVEQMTAATRFRGLQSGVRYAEGFIPCAAWLRSRPQRILP